MSTYSVTSCSIENLIALFSEKTNTSKSHVKEKLHIIFFESYFEHLDAKTIVVEEKYIDHDYLEDYSYYYVKSFKDYERFCIRLHFFSIEFNENDFQKIIISEETAIDNNVLQDNYLGFVVLKPLPQTYIGRTCLKTYSTENKRFFPFSRKYEVNLFGLKLTVKSIAFQEQDSIVAACASSAIWSAFQVTGKLFQHFIPTPVEITRSAIEAIPDSSRHFPNRGLSAEQMAQAIRNVGLDPYLVVKTNHDILKATVYAYQKAEIPLIMGMDLIELNSNEKLLGKHAVTITGYSMAGEITKFNKEDFYLKSSKINKLYVHDDQVGPFARMEFSETERHLTTSWTDSNGKTDNVNGKPDILIIPLYPKIRISFEIILLIISKLNEFLVIISSKTGIEIQYIEWDIFLSKSNDFKHEIRESEIIDNSQKEELLLSSMPKYIWRVIGILDDERIEFIFDSTDIEQGEIFLRYISYGNTILNLFKLIASHVDIEKLKLKPLVKIFERLRPFKRF